MRQTASLFCVRATFLAACWAACLPAPPAGNDPAAAIGAQTSVPVSNANEIDQNTAGASTRQPFSAAQGSMTISAATAPDLCLTVATPTSTSSALVLRTCDASVAQRFVLVSGNLQSANGNCVMLTPGLVSTGGELALAACDPNNANQLVVVSGGKLSIATAAANLSLQSDRSPASTQSYISFAALRLNAPQQQWTLGQASHDNQQALISNGTHIVPLEDINSCLTGALNSLFYSSCSPASPNQAFTLRSDGLVQVGQQCVSLRAPEPILVSCNPNIDSQKLGWKSGIIFNGNGLCIDRDATQPNVTIGKACDFVTSPHFVLGLSQ